MEITSQSIVGQLDPANKHCVDWSQTGLIAFASQNIINVVDSFTLKTVQTINSQRGSISLLKWSSIDINETQSNFAMKLASTDESSIISVWNPFDAKLIQELVEPHTAQQRVLDIKWAFSLENECNQLVCLYSGSKIVVWNAAKGVKLFNETFSDNIIHIAFDPFEVSKVALLGHNSIQFVTFNFYKSVSSEKKNRKSYVISQDTEQDSKKSTNALKEFWFNFISGDNKSRQYVDENMSKTSFKECLKVEFHCSIRNIMFLVYPREVFIFDLAISQIVGVIQLEKNQASICQFYNCYQSDMVYLLHENGSLTVWKNAWKPSECQIEKLNQSKKEPIGELFNSIEVNFGYKLSAQTDHLRFLKNSQIYGFSIDPLSEKFLIILSSDGKIAKYELFTKKKFGDRKANANQIAIAETFLFDLNKAENSEKELKITMVGMSSNLQAHMPFVIRACPPLTKKNYAYWEPKVAIGCPNGTLYVYNLNRNYIAKKMLIYTHPIHGIEWVSMNALISWSYSNSSASINMHEQSSKTVQVRNEVLYTDLRTGESVPLRSSTSEESPIHSIKLSPLKSYAVIIFREQPIEIWDIRSFTMVKRMSKKSANIKVLEWHLYEKRNSPVIKKTDDQFNQAEISVATQKEYHSDTSSELANKEKVTKASKENFMCIDETGLMYSFTLEGNIIKEGAKILPDDGLLSAVTCATIKKDLILYGDSDGQITKWNISSRSIKMMNMKKGEIKKLKFAPGKENFLLLVQYPDNLEIIEAGKFENVSTLRPSTNPKAKLVDCDWCSSEKTIVLFADGFIRLFDINFKQPYNFINCAPAIFSQGSMALLNQSSWKELMLARHVLFQMIDSESNTPCESPNKASTTKPLVQSFNLNMKEMIRQTLVSFQANKGSQLARKINALVHLSHYLNFSRFEKDFWSLLFYIQQDDDSTSSFYEISYLLHKTPMFLKANEFRKLEYHRLRLYKEKAVQHKNHLLISDLLLCKELDLAFNLLLETDQKSDIYISNYLKACLISSLKNSNDLNAQTSIKLVATNFIANGKLLEGVELLCLIDLVFDACRYLQDNDQWEKAAWLAKMRLNTDEYIEVIKRWVEYLLSSKRKELAILLLLSCKQYMKALDLLVETSHYELTFMFAKLSAVFQLISFENEPSINKELFVQLENCEHVKNDTLKKAIQNYSNFLKLI